MVLLTFYLNVAEQVPRGKKHAEMSDYVVLEAGLQLNCGSKQPKKCKRKGG